ncbi:hypothetical protein GCM10027347_50290 [Larkinella harenae]
MGKNKSLNDVEMDKALVIIGIVAGVFGVVYVLAMTRHRERMAMIERNIPASILTGKEPSSYSTLKFGMLLMGIGAGILLGNILVHQYGFNEGVGYWSMIFLMGGLSLILNFIMERKLQKEKENTAD